MKKESSTNLQKYSVIVEQMIKMFSDCPNTTKIILDIIYGDEGIRISQVEETTVIKKQTNKKA